MEKLVFIFKDDLSSNTIHLDKITNLFSLRNKTVHYTPHNAIRLKPKISELLQIWKQAIALLKRLEAIEMFDEDKFSKRLDERVKAFTHKWM